MRKLTLVTLISAGAIGIVLVAAAASTGDDVAAVQTEAVARRNLVSAVPGSGRIEPKRKVDISADISGRVIQLAVQEGAWVNRGDLLLRIDPARYQAALVRAEAGLAQAQAAAENARTNQLFTEAELRRMQEVASGGGFVSAAEMDRARTQSLSGGSQVRAAGFAADQARAALSEARDELSKTTIVAPMSGRVTRLNIQEGETAVVGTMNNPGSLLLTIADLSEMEAHVLVDETDVPEVSVGDQAMVRIDAYPQRAFPGRVTRIANSASRAGGQESAGFRVVIALAEPPAELRPELSASAEIATAARSGVLAVPILALTVRNQPVRGGKPRPTEGVFVVRDGKAEFVPVRVGITGEQHFEVLRGLRPGERVVAGPYETIRALKPGAVVAEADGGA